MPRNCVLFFQTKKWKPWNRKTIYNPITRWRTALLLRGKSYFYYTRCCCLFVFQLDNISFLVPFWLIFFHPIFLHKKYRYLYHLKPSCTYSSSVLLKLCASYSTSCTHPLLMVAPLNILQISFLVLMGKFKIHFRCKRVGNLILHAGIRGAKGVNDFRRVDAVNNVKTPKW